MKSAYTLIEIIIVMSIIAILVGLASLNMVSFSKTADVSSSKAIILAALYEAQANSMALNNDQAWSVHLETNRIVILPGNIVRFYANNTSASWILGGGGSDILFQKRTAKTTNDGTITIMGEGQAQETIEVNGEGRIQ